ncbi:MAG: SAM hydroxide adenosyltransferase [Anaerolineae bacterium]
MAGIITLPTDFRSRDGSVAVMKGVSNVFQGRDILSPVAAHLSLGVAAESFGNLLTTIQGVDLLPLGDELEVVVAGRVISGLSWTYAAAQDGAVIAYIDSSTHLAIAEVRGDAAGKLGADEGDVVEVRTAATEDREASP